MRRGSVVRFVAMVIAGVVAVAGGFAWAQQGGSDGPARVANLPYWAPEDLPLHYCVQGDEEGFTSTDELVEVAAEAFATWGAPTVYDGLCTSPAEFDIDDDDANEISFRDLAGTGGIGIAFPELACRDECEGAHDYRLREADVVVEADPFTARKTRECLKSLLIHETGHALGLSHIVSDGIMSVRGTNGCPTELSERDREMFDNRYGARGDGRDVGVYPAASIEELFVLKTQLIYGAAYLGESDDARTAELYGLHSPAFRAACSLATYRLHLNHVVEGIEDGPVATSFDLARVGGGYAEITYEVTWLPDDADGEWEYETVRRGNPDRWVLIDNRWYDDVDDSTPC